MPITPDQARAELARRELARRGLSTESSEAPAPQPESLQQSIGNAAKAVFTEPAAFAKDLATNPVTMARALPPLLGAAGAVSPIPGGATLGTVGGRQISNAALRLLKRPELIPSGLSQVLEGGLSAAGDIGAIPAIKGAIFGKQIGAAETAAGLGAITKEAPPSGARTAVKYVQGLKGKEFSPQAARQAKAAMDWIFKKGWLQGTAYEPEAVEVSQAIQRGLNQVPGRQVPAQAMAKAMTIPRNINQIYQKIPPAVRKGLGYGTGVGLAGGTAVELIRKLMGN